MPIVKWGDELSVKSNEIDEQHKKLLDIINDLFDAMSKGRGRDVLGGIIDRLMDYTKYHFSTEERLMVSNDYIGYISHKAEHAQLIQKVVEIEQEFKGGNSMLSIRLLNFLEDWLLKHIKSTDKKLGGFLGKSTQ
jgi:hemerythrin